MSPEADRINIGISKIIDMKNFNSEVVYDGPISKQDYKIFHEELQKDFKENYIVKYNGYSGFLTIKRK